MPGGCAKCGAINQATDRFCGGCGAALAPVLAGARSSPPPPPPRRRPPTRQNLTVPIEMLPDAILSETPIAAPPARKANPVPKKKKSAKKR